MCGHSGHVSNNGYYIWGVLLVLLFSTNVEMSGSHGGREFKVIYIPFFIFISTLLHFFTF